MIPRRAHKTILDLAQGFPFVAITGPRQSGKTTLSRAAFPDKPYASLEDPDLREFADNDPRGFLAGYPDGAIFDEVQRCPQLFSYLQTRADLDGRQGLYILTGSQQFGLFSNITQSLAGRVGMVQLLPFSSTELNQAGIPPISLDELLFTGLYPPIYDRPVSPAQWYSGYIHTYLERDVRQMINVRDLSAFQRFLRLCAARTGQLLNLSSLANDCSITHNTAKAWISILEASYIVHLLLPHHSNFNKRLIKSPKLYFHDTGLAAWLVGIHEKSHLSFHPLRGALFETWVVGELLKGRFNRGLPSNLYFWRDSTGNEVDVLFDQGLTLEPLEIKAGQTVTSDYFTGLKKWIGLAGQSAGRPFLVYGGDKLQTRQEVDVIPWSKISSITER
ncbi:ATP-binding protein [Pelotalea chapellei]|uniref:ATP-binding protein n=1 Tax=Pelotalea chapellei TaxID=44671 RepID=A0ABS5U960_9BACT|nr:ATP-binding protein [Pelotalea chapellei]MBT1072228.1 ATP-binding protein [Pelotalea chapellei]